MPYNIPRAYVPIFLIFAVIANAFSLEIYVPSLPYLQQYFDTTQELIQFSLSAGMIGAALISLFLGQLADAYGRRNILIISQALFAACSLLTAFSPTIEIFIGLRLMMGLMYPAAMVISFVVVGDLFEETKASSYYSYITSAMMFAIIIAPYIGGFFADLHRWELNFIFLAVVSGISAILLWLFVPETNKKTKPFLIQEIWRHDIAVVSHPTFLTYTVISAILLGGIVSFFANASFYYIDVLGLKPSTFGKHQMVIATANLFLYILAPKLFARFTVPGTLRIALGLVIIGTISITLMSIFFASNPVLLSFGFTLFLLGASLSFISCFSIVMSSFPEERATVSSLSAVTRGLILASCLSTSSLIYDGKAIQIAYALILFSTISFSLYILASYVKKVKQS